ncbi:MAG: copper-binding protein [Bacteroidota bacterium]
MKALFATIGAVALAAGLVTPAVAADRMEHMDHGAMHAPAAEVPLSDGVVKKVDKAAGKLTVTHGPLPNGMPAMTMAFRVKDAAWLDSVKEGQKIRFAVATLNGMMTIVRLETAK